MRKMLQLDRVAVLALALLLWAAAPPDAPVADRAMRGDVEGVRALLKQGADVNAAQGDGMTALHWAAANGSTEIVQLVVASGANLEAVTRLGGYTPLHLAAKAGRAQTVKLLLAAGANARAKTTTGDVTPLHFAADAGNSEAVAALLDKGADPNARDSEWGQTPLMFAAAANRANVVKLLIERGADPKVSAGVIDMVTRGQEDAALEARRDKLLKALQASGEISREALAQVSYRNGPTPTGAEPGARAESGGPSAVTSLEQLIGKYGGLTALLLAARDGNADAATALLDAGADVNQPSAGDHTTPLLMACINGNYDLAMTFLQRGADVKAASDANNTPLYATINTEWIPKSRHPQPAKYMQQRTSHLELMEAMLKAGADPNQRLKYKLWYTEYSREFLGVDWGGATPFLRAAHALDVDAMRLLVRYGADPNIATLKPAGGRRGGAAEGEDPSGLPPVPAGGPGIYPIHAATGVGYIHDSAGNTHRHVENGWLPAAKYLIEELHADPNARDFEGMTPLHNAAARGDNDLILYLISKGADPHAVARSGQTTVDAANGPHQRLVPFLETVKLLEDMGVKNNHRCVSC